MTRSGIKNHFDKKTIDAFNEAAAKNGCYDFDEMIDNCIQITTRLQGTIEDAIELAEHAVFELL